MLVDHFGRRSHLTGDPQRIKPLAQVFCREGVARLMWVPIFELSLCSIIASGIFGQLEGSRFPSDVSS